MKKVLMVTTLIVGLSTGLSVPHVVAAAETDQSVNQKSTKQSWQGALKAQVALVEAKVSLLQAHSELWLANNREAALRSLSEADASLDQAWKSANQMTRIRITALKLEVSQAKELLREEGQGAEVALQAIADQSESALSAALAHAQTQGAFLRGEGASHYALIQAKAAMLKARIELEIEQSPNQAEHALKEAENAFQQARNTASTSTVENITKLQKQALAAQLTIGAKTGDAKADITALIIATDIQIKTYEKQLQESDEVKRLKKRYAHFEAQAALLKANLAAKADASGQQVVAYLNESIAWYDSLKVDASRRSENALAKMSNRIEETKQAMVRKDKQARAKLNALLKQAAELVKD